jgi:putative intracellular protease/amidase
MTPERYELLCELFDQAQRLPPDQRAAFLEQTCADDPSLRAELEKLLADDQKARAEQLLHEPCPVNAKALLAKDERGTLPGAAPAARPTGKPGDAEPAPAVPRELADHPRYRVVKVLGAGGMGVVYQAVHRLMERAVALKVINRDLTSDPLVVERFRQEVKAAGRLAHANIVTAHDAEQAGNLHFLVMEFGDGISLARVIAKHGPLPVANACNYARQAALGLQHAHEHGMVHRDIKPANLMLTRQGQVKILDFGLARLARKRALAPPPSGAAAGCAGRGSLTEVGAMLGTPDYIAPEQVEDSRHADIRSDLYSLGCTLYFLLAGRVPFPGGSVMDKLLRHGTECPAALEQLRPDVPAGVCAVVERLMAKDPSHRYPTPAEVALALAPFSKACAAPVESPAPESPAPAAPTREAAAPKGRKRPGKRHPAAPRGWVGWAALGAGAAGLAAVAIVLALLAARHASGLGGANQEGEASGPTRPAAPQTAGGATGRESPVGEPSALAPKKVLFVIPGQGFWFPDLDKVRPALARRRVQVVVASSQSPAWPDPNGGGQKVIPDQLLSTCRASDYDAVIFGGGPGIRKEFIDPGLPPAARSLIDDTLRARRPVAAICMGPAVLARAGVLENKQATCVNAKVIRDELQKGKAILADEHVPVVTDGIIVTGRDADAADEFARALREALDSRR